MKHLECWAREMEISLRKWSGGTAQLRALVEILTWSSGAESATILHEVYVSSLKSLQKRFISFTQARSQGGNSEAVSPKLSVPPQILLCTEKFV